MLEHLIAPSPIRQAISSREERTLNGCRLPSPSGNVANVLLIAAWFGLVTGLFEGAGFLCLQLLGRPMYVSTEILWISTLFDLLLFSSCGVVLATLAQCLPWFPVLRVSVFCFGFLAFFDWLVLVFFGRLQPYALLILAIGLATTITRAFERAETTAFGIWRRSLAWVGAVAFLAFVAIQGGLWVQERVAIARLPVAPVGAPSIVVIVVDALRADHLSAYGYTRPTSPTIDHFAQQGVLFENAFSASSYTLPSHASLLTGRYAYEHGAEWSTPRALVDSPYSTLGEELQLLGYRTAAFSANVFWFTREQGFGRGFVHFEDFFESPGDMALRTVYGMAIERTVLQRIGLQDIPARRRAADINRSVLRWVSTDSDRPFFAFLNYMDAHDPYLPPQPWRSKFSQMKSPGGLLNWRLGREYIPLKAEQVQTEMDAYDGGIAYVDDQIADLIRAIGERGLADELLLVITSDHGEAFGEHGTFLHGQSLYREETHVPLILWSSSGRLPAGLRVEQPVSNVALPATVMDLLGDGDESPFPGPPLTQLWRTTQGHLAWTWPLMEIAGMPWKPVESPVSHGWIKSLVSPKWHYIKYETLGIGLYDWRADTTESHDQAANSDMRATIWSFQDALGTILVGEPLSAPRR